MAKRRRSSVVPHNAVSRDPQCVLDRDGMHGFSPVPEGSAAVLSPVGAVRTVLSCLLWVPVSPWSQWGQHPWLCQTTALKLASPLNPWWQHPWLCRTTGMAIRRTKDRVGDVGELWGCSHISYWSHFDRRVSPPCPLLLKSQALLTTSCLLFWCLNAALARDIVSPHVQVTGRAEKGIEGCMGLALRCSCHRGGRGSVGGCLSPL